MFFQHYLDNNKLLFTRIVLTSNTFDCSMNSSVTKIVSSKGLEVEHIKSIRIKSYTSVRNIWPTDRLIRYSRNPDAKFMALFYRTEVIAPVFWHCGNRDFGLFVLLWRWRWSDNLHILTDPYILRIHRYAHYILPTSRLSKVIVR